MVDYPKDWEAVKLYDLMNPYGGLSGKNSEDFKDGNKKYISYLNVFNKPYIENVTEKVNIKSNEKQNIVNNGDVIFTQSSETLDEVGMASTYLGKEEVYLNSFCFGARKKREFDSVFMVLLLRSNEIREKISKEGQGSTRYNLSPNRLMSIDLVIPPIPEQKAIADTLMTFDRHIENLERLIEKKKMIRGGAVEDLMTGRTKLDGFDGDWEDVSFSNYFTKLGNNTLSRDKLSNSGEIYNIHYGDVLIKYGPVLDKISDVPKIKENIEVDTRYILRSQDVVFADTAEDETVGKAVQIGNIDEPIVAGLHTIPCRPNYKTADRFLGYYVNSNVFHDQLLPYITGIKVSSISKKSIDTTNLYIPTNIKEQEAIASILTSMDMEIENLEREKAKIEKVKAGAMDDLLTGRVRLV